MAEETPTSNIQDDLFPIAFQGAQNVVQTGSSGLGREIDEEIFALAENQGAVAEGADINSIIANIQNEQIPGVKARKLRQLQIASQPDELTSGQVIAGGILQIAPILIGLAAAGKQGGAVGAAAGLQGTKSLFGGVEKSQERERQNALVQAELAAGQEKALTGQLFDLQKTGILEEGREGRAARTAGIQQQGTQAELRQLKLEEARASAGTINPTIEAETFKKLTGAESFGREAQRLFQFIDESGFKDDETVLGAISRSVKSGLFKKGDEALLESKLQAITVKLVKAISGAQVSDEERQNIQKVIGAMRTTPIAQTIAAIKNFHTGLVESANIDLELAESAGFRTRFNRVQTIDESSKRVNIRLNGQVVPATKEEIRQLISQGQNVPLVLDDGTDLEIF